MQSPNTQTSNQRLFQFVLLYFRTFAFALSMLFKSGYARYARYAVRTSLRLLKNPSFARAMLIPIKLPYTMSKPYVTSTLFVASTSFGVLASTSATTSTLCSMPDRDSDSKNNNYPLTKVSETEYIEGYWYSEREPHYPFPLQTDVKVNKEFLNRLESYIKSIDESGNDDVLASKIPTSSIQHSYVSSKRGLSPCRLCGICNGSYEYHFKKYVDGVNVCFRAPEGLMHYSKDHNVHPSKEFFDFVMNGELLVSEKKEDWRRPGSISHGPLFR